MFVSVALYAGYTSCKDHKRIEQLSCVRNAQISPLTLVVVGQLRICKCRNRLPSKLVEVHRPDSIQIITTVPREISLSYTQYRRITTQLLSTETFTHTALLSTKKICITYTYTLVKFLYAIRVNTSVCDFAVLP